MADEFPDPDEDDFEDEDYEEEEEEAPYLIYWLSQLPVNLGNINRWESLNHVVVEAHEEEAYVYWERDLTALEKAHVAYVTLERAFGAPCDQVWDFVQDEGQIRLPRRRR